jgi:hypothetical protein
MADANLPLTALAISGTSVVVINWLKASPWFPWLTKEKTALLRSLSAFSALAGGYGIHWAWTASDHQFAVSGLTLSAVWGLGLAIYKQGVLNEIIFRAIKPTSNPAVVMKVAPEEAAKEGITPSGKTP